jgi:RNA polymerase sigma-70 factor (ECF subfamily)
MKVFINREAEIDHCVNECLKGNKKAQKCLFELLSGKMMGICRRYIAEKQAAEDVMIIGFMKVFEKMDQFNHNGSFEGWVRKLMVNEALMYIRANKSVHLVSESDTVCDNLIVEDAFKNLEAEDLLKIIEQLPPGYRTVFNLFAIEGYSHQEIAERLNISENTSKSQLHKARALLKVKLEYINSLRIKSQQNEDHRHSFQRQIK